MEDPTGICAWQRLDEGVTTSGALRSADIDRLAQIGTRHVIDLSTPDNPGALCDEADLLAAAGIAHTAIPIPFTALEEAHYRAFETALDGATRPVHVHCIMNWRVSAFFYRYNRERGMPLEAARALLRQQWEPDRADYPSSDLWAAFIRAVDKAASDSGPADDVA